MSFQVLIAITLVMLLGGEAIAAEKTEGIPANALSEDDRSFSFAVLGHPRGKTSGELSMYFEEIIERIAELNPDFLIITGDIIYGFMGKLTDPDVIRAEWEKFDTGISRLGIPVYRLPGNHDVHNNITRDIYIERYSKVPFAFTFKRSRFILLDTVGIEQQVKGDRKIWKGGSQPFNEKQLNFIRKEVNQQEDYNHLFFFMHHATPWARPSGFWWKDVHNLLIGGKTRVVFAGSPYYFKYAHLEQDGIHYILSSSSNDPEVSGLRRYPDPAKFAQDKQLNNFQYVRVDGEKYTIRIIVIGALSSKVLNWKFWTQLDKFPSSWARRMEFLFHTKFYRLRKFVLLFGVWGGFCLLLGIFLTTLWMRRRT